MSDLLVTWHGWSTLRVDGGLRVLIDPCVSGLLDPPRAWPAEPVDAILVTHGHHEHLRDLHRVLRAIDAPVWAPASICRWLAARRGLDPRRLTPLTEGVVAALPGGAVTPRAFPHLPKNAVSGKLRNLWRRRRTTPWRGLWRARRRVLEAHLVTRDQPEAGPFFAFDLTLPAGRVIWSSEAITELLDPAAWSGWLSGPRPRAVVLGVESGQEAAVRSSLRAIPDGVPTAAVPLHAPFERFYGRAQVDWSQVGAEPLAVGRPWTPGAPTG